MAFQIDPSIPLQAQRTTFDPASILMQAQQNAANLEKHRFEMQKLREDYDIAKEKRAQEKKMRAAIQTDIEQIQRGIPAKYSPLQYQQTPQRGQMPYGMTGVLANERGQNMPQPQAFGEDILAGNFNLSGGDVTQQAQEGRQPTPEEYVQILAKQAMMHGDEKAGFEALKLAVELKKNPNKYFGGLTKGVDLKTNKPLFLAMTETGVVPVDGYQPYEEPKTPKTSLVKTSLGYEVVKEGELPKGKPIEQTTQPRQPRLEKVTDASGTYILDMDTGETRPVLVNGKPVVAPRVEKPDPVTQALTIAEGKAEAKVRQDLIGDAANVVKTYNIVSPMINTAISIVKKLPPDMLQSKYQSMLAGTPLNKYLGNPEQQKAITDYNLILENLRLYIEKPAGAISNYEQGILGRAIGILEGNYSNEQKESALRQVKGIFDNQKNVAENVLKQNKADKFIYNSQENKPLRFTKQANSAQRKEYGDAIFAAKGDPEKIREIQEYARELGVLE